MSSGYEEEDSVEIIDVDSYLDHLPDQENAEVIKSMLIQNVQSLHRRNEAIKKLKQRLIQRRDKLRKYKEELKERNDSIEQRDALIEKKHNKIHEQQQKIKELESELRHTKVENQELFAKASTVSGMQQHIKQLEFQESLKDKLIQQLTLQLNACQEAIYSDRVKIYNTMNKEPESTVEPPDDFIENIHLAAKKGDLKSIQYLIDRCPDGINAIAEKPVHFLFIKGPLYILPQKQDRKTS